MSRSLPLRFSIPLALAALAVALTGIEAAHDRATSYANVEASSLSRATSLSQIVVPELERAVLQGDGANAEQEVARLALMPHLSLALVCDASNQVLYATDSRLRGCRLSATPALRAEPIIARARTTECAQGELTPERATARVACPFLLPAPTGQIRPSRLGVLYLETDLVARKQEEWAGIVQRAGLMGAAALVACFLVWAYLRATFTRHLDKLVRRVAAYAPEQGDFRAPAEGPQELAQVGRVLNQMFAELSAQHAALAESRERFARAFQHTPMLMSLSDLDTGRFIDVNEEFLRVNGFTREELIGRTAVEVGWLAPEARSHIVAGLRQHGRVNGVEFPFRKQSGQVFPGLYFGEVLTIGGKAQILSLVQDLTERKRAEEALRTLATSLAHLSGRAFFEAASRHLAEALGVDYVFVAKLDATGKNVSALGGWARGQPLGPLTYALADGPCNNLLGKGVYTCHSGVQAQFPKDLLLAQMGIEGYFGSVILDKAGRPLGIMVALQTRPLVDPEAMRQLFTIYLDRVAAEMQRVEATEALEQERRLLRTLVDLVPDFIFIKDPQGRFLLANESLARSYGHAPAALLGHTDAELLPADLAARFQPGEARALAARSGVEIEDTVQFPDGQWRTVVTNMVAFRDARGEAGGLVGIGHDITLRKRLEQQLQQAQRMEAVGHLAGGLAHDFNNLLAVNLLHLGLLQQQAGLAATAAESVKQLMTASQRAADLTRKLLMFSRQSVLQVRTLDMNEVAGDLLKMLGRLIGEDISLRFERSVGLPPVEADASMIEQVLMNLVVNARDAMPKGGALTIGLAAVQVEETRAQVHPEARPGRFVSLSVTDNGCGMDPATRARIFEPFFTTKPAGKGTGLGLATVHGIVGQHQGWVEVESELGRGTTFRVFLPAGSGKKPPPPVAEAAEIVHGQETILLVEDEPSVRQVTAQTLGFLGYHVLEAADGEAALQIWREHEASIDLVLSDMVMPGGMTGLELVAELAALRPGLKVIVATGYSEEMVTQGIPEGLQVTQLQKPYELHRLSRALRQCLGAKPKP